ncbi:Dihydrofolate reductase [Candidatus Erwinia haradaeae]|uniref:Dihydrofolate reductase n=1 Tax=Candidatus Erwinia haradaeae TaxID=1922217 RepID=A0A451DDG4_9GAMM|nr:type 3 dihydrofolate reductase [Candidatus Erwinia haradaeae]VFP84508.1 Dihydrofolate reductase [Candidatus Erwinia haradaeae]
MISLIAAVTINDIIGRQSTIPWFLPADLDWFQKNTLNKPIIMGRCTWDSLPFPLSGRVNIILSRFPRISTAMVRWVTNIEDVFSAAGEVPELMVIGGGEVYQQFISSAQRLYLTHINKIVIGDTHFPHYERTQWKEIFSQYYERNAHNKYDLFFEILERSTIPEKVFSAEKTTSSVKN